MKRVVLLMWLSSCAGAQAGPPAPPPDKPAEASRPSLPRPSATPAPPEQASATEPAGSASAAGGQEAPPDPLDKDSVRAVIRSWYPEIKGCYERAFRDNQSLRGKVVARFMINEDGSVSSVDMSDSTMKKRDVVDCVGKLFGLMQFPKPENGMVLITYPLEFDAEVTGQ